MRKKLEKIYMALIFILLYAPIVTLVAPLWCSPLMHQKRVPNGVALRCTGTVHCLPIQRS